MGMKGVTMCPCVKERSETVFPEIITKEYSVGDKLSVRQRMCVNACGVECTTCIQLGSNLATLSTDDLLKLSELSAKLYAEAVLAEGGDVPNRENG